MNRNSTLFVDSEEALRQAVRSEARSICVNGVVALGSTVTLHPEQRLFGADDNAGLVFSGDGILLTSDNSVANLTIRCPRAKRSISRLPRSGPAGHIDISSIKATGSIQLLFGDGCDGGQVTLNHVWVEDADTSEFERNPKRNGVEVLQGAVTIWNKSRENDIVHLKVSWLSVGAAEKPVTGSGVFIAGGPNGAGKVCCKQIEVQRISANSALEPEETEIVAGGVFLLQGVDAAEVICSMGVTTYGANAVPVDNWGTTDLWRVEGDIVSYGPSALGVVNAGSLGQLHVNGNIRTYGPGAKGCGIYGDAGEIRAGSIHTHGDAAIGVQILGSLNRLVVDDGITTTGAPGRGLVKGVMLSTPAHGVHIGKNGVLETLEVNNITCLGADAEPLVRES